MASERVSGSADQQVSKSACFRRDEEGWCRDELHEIDFDN
jgi:hypothetical protein